MEIPHQQGHCQTEFRGYAEGMKMDEITQPIKEGFSEAYENVQENVSDRTKLVVRTTDEWVHDNPWKLIAIVAVTSLVLGVLLGNRGRRDDD
jgi:ElaB/YqjD/DUF883 family membrane-anchored ribosome-binding protein